MAVVAVTVAVVVVAIAVAAAAAVIVVVVAAVIFLDAVACAFGQRRRCVETLCHAHWMDVDLPAETFLLGSAESFPLPILASRPCPQAF